MLSFILSNKSAGVIIWTSLFRIRSASLLRSKTLGCTSVCSSCKLRGGTTALSSCRFTSSLTAAPPLPDSSPSRGKSEHDLLDCDSTLSRGSQNMCNSPLICASSRPGQGNMRSMPPIFFATASSASRNSRSCSASFRLSSVFLPRLLSVSFISPSPSAVALVFQFVYVAPIASAYSP